MLEEEDVKEKNNSSEDLADQVNECELWERDQKLEDTSESFGLPAT